MIVSFYSYKGGVGRSQLCANVAAYLCYQKKRKVLLWDWDFEAAGLHYFFDQSDRDIQKEGTLELLENYVKIMRAGRPVDSSEVQYISPDKHITPLAGHKSWPTAGCIDLLAAGCYSKDFARRSNQFNWTEFYSILDGVTYFEKIKEKLPELGYDFILIDSRTGISDYSGICNIQLPDVNVIMVAPTLQNFEGSKYVIKRIIEAEYTQHYRKDPFILPVLTRLDRSYPDFDKWKGLFEAYFSSYIRYLDPEYDNELHAEVFSDVYFFDTFIPYIVGISAGEHSFFASGKDITRSDFTLPFINMAEYMECLKEDRTLNFYRRIDEVTWKRYAEHAEAAGKHRVAAIAYTSIGIKQADPDEKRLQYEKAIAMDRTYAPAWYHLGNCSIVQGDTDQAIEFLQTAISLDASFEKAFIKLNLVLEESRSPELIQHLHLTNYKEIHYVTSRRQPEIEQKIEKLASLSAAW